VSGADPYHSDPFPPYAAPRARNDDPSTSHAAAERVDEFSHKHYALILADLKRCYGTIYQIAAATGLSHVQVARRMPELQKLGKVETSGFADGPTGRRCRVWWLTPSRRLGQE
jgi:predicted ArsR family transcriptional regulator